MKLKTKYLSQLFLLFPAIYFKVLSEFLLSWFYVFHLNSLLNSSLTFSPTYLCVQTQSLQFWEYTKNIAVDRCASSQHIQQR